jgi:hypothetical protein
MKKISLSHMIVLLQKMESIIGYLSPHIEQPPSVQSNLLTAIPLSCSCGTERTPGTVDVPGLFDASPPTKSSTQGMKTSISHPHHLYQIKLRRSKGIWK